MLRQHIDKKFALAIFKMDKQTWKAVLNINLPVCLMD